MAAKAQQAAKQPEVTPGTVANPSPPVPSEESAGGHAFTRKQGGRSGGKPTATPTPKGPSISWDADPTHMDKLVSWIVSHSGDCNILFHDCLSNITPLVLSPDDKPSGKNKKEVTSVITKHIFEHDVAYASLYALDPGKFATSVTNQLAMGDPAADEDGTISNIPECHDETMDFMMDNPEIPGGFGDDYSIGGAMNEDHDDDGMGGLSNPASHVHMDVGSSYRKDAVPTPFVLKDKPRMPSLDACNAFTRHSPYACPPTSVSGASMKPSSQSSTTSSTKKVSSVIAKKLEELDKESDMYCGELEDLQTCHAALCYNYAIWDKELDLQQEVLNLKNANAEIKFRHEQDLKRLEIELKKAEESTFSWQIKLLQLQITLKTLEQGPLSSTAPSRNPSASASPSSG
ncbi:hypothetical protein EDC04DRAFT_2887319 [Pisolithus marmoratus]|nr:hypothetical protein EDC04DRAFT_2887319 [Pisolithus marmoratus]